MTPFGEHLGPRTLRSVQRANAPPSDVLVKRTSDWSDVLRLQSLRALDDLEGDLLAFGQGPKSIRLDGGVVAEHVFSAPLLCNETEALRVVEPLHGTNCHCCCLLSVLARE